MHPPKQAVLFGLEMPSDDFAKELRVPLRLCPRVTYSASVALAVTVRHIELEPVAPGRAFVLGLDSGPTRFRGRRLAIPGSDY